MKLVNASHYANVIATWLRPYVHRIEIAGSVRRERPVCNDIDLVCIPKLEKPFNDLLGEPDGMPKSLLREFLVHYVKASGGKAWFRSNADPQRPGPEPKTEAVNIFLRLPKCDLDVFAANEETFITRLITRTGSKEHNIWIAERAKKMGGSFVAQTGLVMKGKRLVPLSEEEFYAALDLPLIAPKDRELEYLRRHFK